MHGWARESTAEANRPKGVVKFGNGQEAEGSARTHTHTQDSWTAFGTHTGTHTNMHTWWMDGWMDGCFQRRTAWGLGGRALPAHRNNATPQSAVVHLTAAHKLWSRAF